MRNLAIDLRVALIKILSPSCTCAMCGRVARFASELQIDHVNGRAWSVRALGSTQRAKRYWLEYASGVRLRALCISCNSTDGNHRRWSAEKRAA